MAETYHGIANPGFVPDCKVRVENEVRLNYVVSITDHKSTEALTDELGAISTEYSETGQHNVFESKSEIILDNPKSLNGSINNYSFEICKEVNFVQVEVPVNDIRINEEKNAEDHIDEISTEYSGTGQYNVIENQSHVEPNDQKILNGSINTKSFENYKENYFVKEIADIQNIKDNAALENKPRNVSNVIKTTEDDVFGKFVRPLYKSFTEKDVTRLREKIALYDSSKNHRRYDENQLELNLKPSTPELSRSQYSLVSTGELTAEALQVWLGLPKKIKYDPELAPFRQRYEKEYGKAESVALKSKNGSAPETKRLPLVKSAPHLNNNVRVADEAACVDGKSDVEIHDPARDSSGLENGTLPKRQSKLSVARHYVKMTLLLACWIFFTAVFLMYNEKEEVYRNSAVNPGEVKNYTLNITDSGLTVKVKLSGPFVTEQSEGKMNKSEMENAHKMVVWLERWESKSGDVADAVGTESHGANQDASSLWTIILQDAEDLDFSTGEPRSSTIALVSNRTEANRTSVYALRMRSTAPETVPFTMNYTLNPLDVSSGVILACLLLCGLYVLIIFEVINRTMAAVLISTTSLATLAIVGERPTLPQLISWLDMETLLLLFSMMLLVAIMAETGMFDFLAVFTFEVTKGKLWPLITLLCIITALLSTFLDNVTTVLLMTPVTIRLCEVMDLDPVPILMSMVLFSNIGGTATPVGDPPNVIIASNKNVVQAGINFTNFTMHMTLGILLVCVQTYFQLRYIYRDTNKLRLNVPREIQDLRHQISIWRRAIESLPHLTKDQHVVRERLERKMKKLNLQLETMIKESNKRVCPKDTFQSTLEDLKQKYKIRDKMLLLKSTIAISFVVTVFFLHSIPELNRVSLGWTALLGAILLLTLADREDLEPILHRVEWSTLLFFASLFVLMEALSKLGLIEFIGGLTESVILGVDEKARLAVALLLMLWVSGVTSAFVDNIPLTTMMVRVVIALGSNPNLNLPMAPLIWALSFGACLGGNGTLIGASANVVCAGVAEQHGYRFTFMQFFRVGFPVMIGHLIVASAYLLLCHCVFTWH